MTDATQLELIFLRDLDEQPPMWLHDRLLDERASWEQVELLLR